MRGLSQSVSQSVSVAAGSLRQGQSDARCSQSRRCRTALPGSGQTNRWCCIWSKTTAQLVSSLPGQLWLRSEGIAF
jgi:hypothetical protein